MQLLRPHEKGLVCNETAGAPVSPSGYSAVQHGTGGVQKGLTRPTQVVLLSKTLCVLEC